MIRIRCLSRRLGARHLGDRICRLVRKSCGRPYDNVKAEPNSLLALRLQDPGAFFVTDSESGSHVELNKCIGLLTGSFRFHVRSP